MNINTHLNKVIPSSQLIKKTQILQELIAIDLIMSIKILSTIKTQYLLLLIQVSRTMLPLWPLIFVKTITSLTNLSITP